MCAKNYALSRQFLIGFNQHALWLHSQYIKELNKMFLNSWMLWTYYLKSAKKNVLQLHVSTVPFPTSHWLWINHNFIYIHVFLQRCKQAN